MSLKQVFARTLCDFSAFTLCVSFTGAQDVPAWVQDASKAYPESDLVISYCGNPDRQQVESAVRAVRRLC